MFFAFGSNYWSKISSDFEIGEASFSATKNFGTRYVAENPTKQ